MTDTPALDKVLVSNWRDGHKFASTWVAGFWGAFGGALTILPVFLNMQDIWWLGPTMIFMAVTFAIARFTRQPGTECG